MTEDELKDFPEMIASASKYNHCLPRTYPTFLATPTGAPMTEKTPRTDAEYETNGHEIHSEGEDGDEVIEQAVNIKFARQLERELAQANESDERHFAMFESERRRADEAQARIEELEKDTLTLQGVEAGNMLFSMQGPPELLSGKPHKQSDDRSGQEKTPENGVDR